jgi:ABC-type uncharacterized transport system substrate-binding protein
LLQEKLPCQKTNCYKVYINQPVHRYIKLYKILFPQGKKLVFTSTSERLKLSQKIKTVSKKQGIAYKTIPLGKNENISRAFIEILNSNDVLLALPDAIVYNANNAKSIILTTYHANVPIIAYSKSFAKAGALISLYSSIENVAEKTAVLVNAISRKKLLTGKEYYPDNFMLEVNTSVARSLNIELESASEIKRKIK